MKNQPSFNAMPQSLASRADRLKAVYAKLPAVECQGNCQQSCGPIGLYPVEVSLLRSKHLPLPVIQTDTKGAGAMDCSALTDEGQCSIYEYRPLICRLWGNVRAMACPWGCVPDRWLDEKDASAIMDELMELSGMTKKDADKMYWSLCSPREMLAAMRQIGQAGK